MREADLERHLSNPTEQQEEKPGAAPAKDQGAQQQQQQQQQQPQQQQQGAGAAPKEPAEMGSKGDYQLNQALNLLKGLQIISKR
jgi:carboxyl-terminal processing protease